MLRNGSEIFAAFSQDVCLWQEASFDQLRPYFRFVRATELHAQSNWWVLALGRVPVSGPSGPPLLVVTADTPKRLHFSAVVRHGCTGNGPHIQKAPCCDRRTHDMRAVAHAHQDRAYLKPAALHFKDIAHA